MGREKQRSHPGLQPFGLKQLACAWGSRGPPQTTINGMLGLERVSEAYEARASVHISTPHHFWNPKRENTGSAFVH